jgi:DNA-binding NarL/FixJ family response regulator
MWNIRFHDGKAAERMSTMHQPSHPVRVLLVDDSATFLDSATRFLTVDPHIEISGRALSGFEAIDQVRQTAPDVVLMDIAMPGMNGLEATRQIKRHPNAPRVIIVTMSDDPEYHVAAVDVGADGFLPKMHCRTRLLPLIHALFPKQ